MKRTKLKDRILPDYTKGEELMNTVTHIVGAVLGVTALVLCILQAASKGNVWGVVGASVYGATVCGPAWARRSCRSSTIVPSIF